MYLSVHAYSLNVKLIVRNHPSLLSALTLKWASRLGTIIFFVLAVFFAVPYSGYRSYFRQQISLLGISTSSVVYLQLRITVYICSLAFGLLFIAAFLKKVKDGEGARGIAAINCAWMAYVLQASIGLSIQWFPVAIWISNNNTLNVLFIATVILLATSLILLTNYGWVRRFGYLLSGFSLFCSLFGFFMMVKYFVLFLDPFPTLMMVMTITSVASIHYLGKFDLKKSGEKNGVYDRRRFIQELKRFFTSSKILAMILASVLILDSIAFVLPDHHWISNGSATKDFYCGVSFCGNTTAEAELLIDRVKNFTNVFVVQSLPISENEAVLNEICNYAVDSGLYVIVYFAFLGRDYWQACWVGTAKERGGEKI